MASAIDFVMIFVSLELVTMSFYVLVSFTRRNPATLEAGVKYLILSALSTGFLVYGITWIFGVTGETNLARIGTVLATQDIDRIPLLFGIALVLVALGFKIAAVPFQIWVPDVYQGAPTPVTAFLSVGSKAAGFVVLLRVLAPFLMLPQVGATARRRRRADLDLRKFRRAPAIESETAARLFEHRARRLSADRRRRRLPARRSPIIWSRILLMTLLCFAVLIVVGNNAGEQIDDYAGLAKRSPFLAFAMLIGMMSLAGVPFTAGFLGKFFIFDAAIRQHQTLLVVIGVITVGCGFYYYLKVVRAMYWLEPVKAEPVPLSALSRLTMILLIAAIFVLGVYPQPVLNALNQPTRPTTISMSR